MDDEIGYIYINTENNKNQKVYRYNLGTDSISSNQHLDILRLVAICFKLKKQPIKVLNLIHKYTNACMYHVCGCCIHPECAWSHDTDINGILVKYVKASEKFYTDRPDLPDVYKEAQGWMRCINML